MLMLVLQNTKFDYNVGCRFTFDNSRIGHTKSIIINCSVSSDQVNRFWTIEVPVNKVSVYIEQFFETHLTQSHTRDN